MVAMIGFKTIQYRVLCFIVEKKSSNINFVAVKLTSLLKYFCSVINTHVYTDTHTHNNIAYVDFRLQMYKIYLSIQELSKGFCLTQKQYNSFYQKANTPQT